MATLYNVSPWFVMETSLLFYGFLFTPSFSGTQPGSETTAWCIWVSTVSRWSYINSLHSWRNESPQKRFLRNVCTHIPNSNSPPSWVFPLWDIQISSMKRYGFAWVSSELPSKYRRGQNHGSCQILNFAVVETVRGWNELWLSPNTFFFRNSTFRTDNN